MASVPKLNVAYRDEQGDLAYLKMVMYRNSSRYVREIKNGKANLPVVCFMLA